MEKKEFCVVYLAGKLRGNFITKWLYIRKAKRMAEFLWINGVVVVSPHANSGWVDTPETDKFVLPANIHLMKMCDAVVLLDNWKTSVGTREEIKEALKSKMPIFTSGMNLVLAMQKTKDINQILEERKQCFYQGQLSDLFK